MSINHSNLKLSDKKIIKTKPSEIRLINTLHFIEQMIQREIYDFGLIAKLMSVLLQTKIGGEVEISDGFVTLVACRETATKAKLITCWKGERNAKNML